MPNNFDSSRASGTISSSDSIPVNFVAQVIVRVGYRGKTKSPWCWWKSELSTWIIVISVLWRMVWLMMRAVRSCWAIFGLIIRNLWTDRVGRMLWCNRVEYSIKWGKYLVVCLFVRLLCQRLIARSRTQLHFDWYGRILRRRNSHGYNFLQFH